MDKPQTLQQQVRRMASVFISLGLPYKECAKAFQKEFIVMMLVAHEGNQCRAAKALGIHRNTLQRTMRALKIDVNLLRGGKLKAMGERPNISQVLAEGSWEIPRLRG